MIPSHRYLECTVHIVYGFLNNTSSKGRTLCFNCQHIIGIVTFGDAETIFNFSVGGW